jgi:hypothetical protein
MNFRIIISNLGHLRVGLGRKGKSLLYLTYAENDSLARVAGVNSVVGLSCGNVQQPAGQQNKNNFGSIQRHRDFFTPILHILAFHPATHIHTLG